MSDAEIVAVALAVGMVAGTALWEWLRGDLFPQLGMSRIKANEARLNELEKALECTRHIN